MAADIDAIYDRILRDFPFYASLALKIRTKDGSILPFELNPAQQYLHARMESQLAQTGSIRVLVLKGRQQGCSTYVEGRFYWRTTTSLGKRTFILTHHQEATNNIFEMAKRYHEHNLDELRPATNASNAKELIFGSLDSGYRVGTAGSAGVGRSSTVQYLHGSEVAFWPNATEHFAGLMQAVPNVPGTEVVLESTANGVGGLFHEMWQEAEQGLNGYEAIFIPWYWQPEYRLPVPDGFRLEPDELDYANAYKLDLGQMAWRRQKIKELRDPLLFRQEYPATPAEAFVVTGLDAFIPGDAVAAARTMGGVVEGYGPIILGVDPAREGSDRTALVFRQGRKAYGLEYHSKKDNMEIAGIVAGHLRRMGSALARVFVDVGGGGGIIDRLHELGFKNQVRAVNFGSKAMDQVRYRNKRAEMWGEMKEWLTQDMPVCLPDDNLLHADLVAPSYKWNSSNQLLLESKEEIKKRGLRSPDGADALALTFAEPVVTPEMEAQRHRYRPRRAHRAATSAGY